jgi:hypothetical protein
MIASADYAGAGSDLVVHGSPERGNLMETLCVSLICDLCRTPAVKSQFLVPRQDIEIMNSTAFDREANQEV